MSATKPGRELASPDSRRRPRVHSDSQPQRAALLDGDPEIGARVAGGRDSPSPRPATSAHAPARTTEPRPRRGGSPSQRAERARAGRLRSLWQMTPEQRDRRDAPRRSDLRAARRMERTASRPGARLSTASSNGSSPSSRRCANDRQPRQRAIARAARAPSESSRRDDHHGAHNSRRRGSARQLPAHPGRAGARRAAARDPLRAPPPRHGPPVHRRPQRARRLTTHPPARRLGPTSTSASACAPAAPAAATRSTAPTSRSSRSTRQTPSTDSGPSSIPRRMIISSGSAGHAHAYFTLSAPVTVPELERANRRLAHALGGDLASVDAARILRPPSSWNHKHSPPAPRRADRTRPGATVRPRPSSSTDSTTRPAGHPSARRHRRRTGRTEIDRLLLAIPAAEYVHALTGISPDRTGKIHCPFHDDRTPSLQLYEDGTWYCYGACKAGGSIFDFAARAWQMRPKGPRLPQAARPARRRARHQRTQVAAARRATVTKMVANMRGEIPLTVRLTIGPARRIAPTAGPAAARCYALDCSSRTRPRRRADLNLRRAHRHADDRHAPDARPRRPAKPRSPPRSTRTSISILSRAPANARTTMPTS